MSPDSGTSPGASSTPLLVLVLTTLDTGTDADAFARSLVDERLAACVNVLPPMQSVYRWQGAVETATERQIIIKTTDARLPALRARLAQLHPYDVAELLVLQVAESTTGYQNWLVDAVG